MKTRLKLSLVILTLTLAVSSRAHAGGFGDRGHQPPPPPPTRCNPPASAPEVDPSMAIAGLTLLGGSLTVLRARRRK